MGKDEALNVRIDKSDKDAFMKKCEKVGRNYSDVVREMITAFNEGRLKITQTEEQKKMEEYYD